VTFQKGGLVIPDQAGPDFARAIFYLGLEAVASLCRITNLVTDPLRRFARRCAGTIHTIADVSSTAVRQNTPPEI
jgi:hypothetical protein